MVILYNNYSIYMSDSFKKEFNNILFYINSNLGNPFSSLALYRKIMRTLENLKYFPKLHPRVKLRKYKDKEIRKVPINKYIIIYEVNNSINQVSLLHIFHSTQDYLKYI